MRTSVLPSAKLKRRTLKAAGKWHRKPMASSREHYQYDEHGKLLRSVDAEGRTTTYEYDQRGNLVSKFVDDPAERQRERDRAARLRIFVCHSSGDKQAVKGLCSRLRKDGFDPWLDEEKLLPGQDWDLEIRRAVKASHVVIVCLSQQSITKAGYVQKEIKFSLDVADEQPEGVIFLIPLRLENCTVPDRLQKRQWVDLFHENGYKNLLRALKSRVQDIK